MTSSSALLIYLAGAALVALRHGWHIRYRMDKYDRKYCNVRSATLFNSLLWPLHLLHPGQLIHPKFHERQWCEGRAAKERELDRLAAHPPPCSALIRYAPERDEGCACQGEFTFEAAEVVAIMEARLADLPAKEHGRYADILNWLNRRDVLCRTPTDLPAPWYGHFHAVAVGMMKRNLGQVRCRQCNALIPHESLSIPDGPKIKGSGWRFCVWFCPQGHPLLTKESMHFFISSNR